MLSLTVKITYILTDFISNKAENKAGNASCGGMLRSQWSCQKEVCIHMPTRTIVKLR